MMRKYLQSVMQSEAGRIVQLFKASCSPVSVAGLWSMCSRLPSQEFELSRMEEEEERTRQIEELALQCLFCTQGLTTISL